MAASAPARVDGRTARWAGHRAQRRTAIVDAAIAVIEREGPGATVEQFGAELGVTRQVLYRHFSDRADLDRAITERAASQLVEDLLPHLDLGGDIPTSIRTALGAYLDYIEEHLSLYRFVRAHDSGVEAGSPETADASAVRQVKDTVAGRVAAIARGLTGDDVERPGELLAVGVVGMADAVISHWLDSPGDCPRDQLLDRLTLMLAGAVSAVQAQR
jgi:AcrR family transcriptional regulator